MGDTLQTFDGMLKQYYDDDTVMNLIYNKNPFLTMIPKDEGWVGDTYKQGIIYDGNNAVGHDFTRAQAQSRLGAQGVDAFLLSTRSTMYGFTNIARQLLLASDTNLGAFLSAQSVSLDNVLRNFGNRLATALWRSGYGDQGIVSPVGFNAAGTTIQLLYPEDVVNFESGMALEFATTQTAAPKANGSSGPLTITGVDRSNGILSFGVPLNDATNGCPTIAASDYIFLYTDAVTGTNPVLIRGVEAWVPPVAPGSGDSFWNVNRSKDSRLSGQRLNATDGRPLEEVLIEGASIVNREGGTLSHYFMSYGNFAKLEKQMQGRVLYTKGESDIGISFSGIRLRTGVGDVEILPDRTCPSNRVFGVEMESWTLATLKKMIQPVNDDGLEMLRQSDADNFEMRWAFYGQPVCRAPGHNINIQVPTP